MAAPDNQPNKPTKPRKPQDANYVRKRVPVQKLQRMKSALESQITSGTGSDGKKLTVRELVGLCNSAASLARPLAMADKDAGDKIKKLKAAKNQAVWHDQN
jgi:hypothetical protein